MFNLINNRILKHSLFWLSTTLFYLCIKIPNLGADFTNSAIWIIWIMPVYMVSTYCLIYFLIPKYLLRKKYFLFSFLVLIWVIASAFFNDIFSAIYKAILFPVMFNIPCDCKFDWALLKQNYFRSFEYYAFFVAFLAGGIKLFEFWNEKQKLNIKLSQEKIEAQIKLIKTQLHPEFLFKTLDNIHHLIAEKSKLTPTVVMKFSHLLSYLLYESETERVSLEKEIEMIQDFIYLEKIDDKDHLEVSLNFTGEIDTTKIAPLLLFPLVESAFQNIDNNDENGIKWLSIDVSVQNFQLIFKMIFSQINKVKYENNDAYKNFLTYLGHIYPNQFELKVSSQEDFFVLNLRLKLS